MFCSRRAENILTSGQNRCYVEYGSGNQKSFKTNNFGAIAHEVKMLRRIWTFSLEMVLQIIINPAGFIFEILRLILL